MGRAEAPRARDGRSSGAPGFRRRARGFLQVFDGLNVELGQLGTSSLVLFVMRVSNTALLFAISIFLSRVLGPHEYGIYAFGVALLAVMIVPASLGFENLLAAELPTLAARGRHAEMRGLVRSATRMAAVAALAITGLWALLAFWRLPILDPLLWVGGAVVLTALAPLAVMRVRLGALRGQHRVAQGQFPLFVIQPTIMLVVALAFVGFAPDRFGGISASALFAFSFLGASLLSIAALPRLFEPAGATADERRAVQTLLFRALPFVVLGGVAVAIAQLGVLMLGAILGAREAGLYQPAVLLAAFVSLGHNIINQPLGPRIAQLHAENRRETLQRTLDRSYWAGLGFGLPVALILMFCGGPILRLFGAEFENAAVALALLAGGQLLSVGLGPSALILMMMGRQKLLSTLMMAAALLNVVFNALLIPALGIEGAALASLLTVACWATAASYIAAVTLGLRSSFLTGWLVRKPDDRAGMMP